MLLFKQRQIAVIQHCRNTTSWAPVAAESTFCATLGNFLGERYARHWALRDKECRLLSFGVPDMKLRDAPLVPLNRSAPT